MAVLLTEVLNFLCKALRGSSVFVAALTHSACKFCEASDTDRSLNCEVNVVCKVTCKVIGAELVFRLKTELGEVFNPFFEKVIVFAYEINVAVAHVARIRHYDHICTFLNRHLHIVFKYVAAGREEIDIGMSLGESALEVALALCKTVNLTAADGISSNVVRCEVILPYGHSRKLKYRSHHTLYVLGVCEQIERYGGVGYVNRADTTVGAAFFREEYYVSVSVLYELVCRD